MTDASYPVKPINGLDLSHASISAAYPLSRHQHYHAPDADVPEDDGLISCICDFADDDGLTVACDACNRWQHQSCYYPQYDERELPPDLQHYCVDCRPRDIDIHSAHRRQKQKREQTEAHINGIKRSAPKSHKKKVKEPAAPYTNGWTDKIKHDRNSASPRDQAPPAKRPKTSHRTSDSTTTTTTKGHSRKRNVSNAHHRRSVSRSPDSPVDQYSEEFLQCYHEDAWAVTNSNLFNSIAITNALSEWLNSSDEEFRSMHVQPKGEVLNRWDGSLDDIPGKAQIEITHHQDPDVRYRGQMPTWKSLTVAEPVANGAYIGELKGHVGFKKDYQQEITNRWSQLRHPEPFVFFHPKLPIVIDARHEGTELRYVRRSCMPNARLQILVTNSADYHFCFMATQQIEPGDEIAVGWDTSDGLPELTSRNGLTDDELELLAGWVSTALANCGPCACLLPDNECRMSRFDRRTRIPQEEAQPAKVPKGKKRKAGQHVSPINTHAVNSRSGSEARKIDLDDEPTDSRSTSGSAGRGSASRDITPNTHYSTNGLQSGMTELSERERKKLAKEEEIFRRQEDLERAGKQAKKKRNSNGSNLNTPSATSSKQLGFPSNNGSKYVDAGTSRQAGLPSTKATLGRKPKASKAQPRPISRMVKRVKPDYVDAHTQCDLDQEEAARRSSNPTPRKPYISTRQRLLERCARNNSMILAGRPRRGPSETRSTDIDQDKMDLDAPAEDDQETRLSPVPILAPAPKTSVSTSPPEPSPHKDVDMEDADSVEQENRPPSPVDLHHHTLCSPEDTVNSNRESPLLDTAPPWPPPKASTPGSETAQWPQKPTDMHLQMPPPTANPFAPPVSQSSTGTPNTITGSVLHSPATLGPGSVFSPAVTAAVTPPTRKKLSLSDYTRRKANKDKDHEVKGDRESSPASVTSGPVAPPLLPSSSSEARAAEGGSAIDEDVKMEEAGDSASTTV